MTLVEINAVVDAELAAFAQSDGDLTQGLFRSNLQNLRASSLGRRAEIARTAAAAYEAALAATRQQCGDPTWTPLRTMDVHAV